MTCKQDNLGIPRCLGAEVDCTDPTNYIGQACATSADCCNLPCVPNPAGDPPFVCGGDECVPVDGACTTNADCCSLSMCVIQPGSTSGTCGTPPPGGEGGAGGGGPTGTCAEYGQTCMTNDDCCGVVPCSGGLCLIPR
jgi:hypothetical protein